LKTIPRKPHSPEIDLDTSGKKRMKKLFDDIKWRSNGSKGQGQEQPEKHRNQNIFYGKGARFGLGYVGKCM
jgi:hypothetical protein